MIEQTVSEEILINVTPRETRVAKIEGGMLQEVYVERARRRGFVGNIYKGRVLRVMPGMQAAFVDVGLERAAFLHVSDIVSPHGATEPDAADDQTGADAEGVTTPNPTPSIETLIHEGEQITVQVIRDPIGSKGARISAYLSIPSRYLVLLPYAQTLGVSARIDDEEERARLKTLMQAEVADGELGFIVRTNAEGHDRASLAFDMDYLKRVWRVVQNNIDKADVGDCVYEELSLPLRTVRDQFYEGVKRVRVDHPATCTKVREFVAKFISDLSDRVELYDDELSIFELYGVEDEIKRALDKHVPLKSGGSLVIDQTEAMTTVDVNTGGYLGSRNLEETAYRTNLEAAQATARQLRLRNLGGIVIIDFIDMIDSEHKRQVLRMLEKWLARDSVKTTVYPMSELGLVEMTRKRTSESLERQLCEPCPTCGGRGTVRSAETVTHEIFREITRSVRQFNADKLMVMAHPLVVDRLLEEESSALAELEELIGKDIALHSEDQYTQEQFDVVLL